MRRLVLAFDGRTYHICWKSRVLADITDMKQCIETAFKHTLYDECHRF